MTTALALTLRLLLVAEGDCSFVGNTRTFVLPSCDIGPATIAGLTERCDVAKGAFCLHFESKDARLAELLARGVDAPLPGVPRRAGGGDLLAAALPGLAAGGT